MRRRRSAPCPRASRTRSWASTTPSPRESKRAAITSLGEALQPIHTATTVRIRNGKLSTTDGPYAETKEQLGGFYLINARDLNDAIQVASKIPSARLGSVEVRPIMVFNQQ